MRTLKELARPEYRFCARLATWPSAVGRDTNSGRIAVQSTPGYEARWFFELADARPPDWSLMRVRSKDAATIAVCSLDFSF